MSVGGNEKRWGVQGPPRFLVGRTGEMALPSKEMKSAGRGADVERGGSCLSHAQHGLGAIGMFCDLGKSRNSSE